MACCVRFSLLTGRWLLHTAFPTFVRVKVPCALLSAHCCSERWPPFKGCLFLNCSLEYLPLECTAALECWAGAQLVSRAQNLPGLRLFLWGPTLEHLVLFGCN